MPISDASKGNDDKAGNMAVTSIQMSTLSVTLVRFLQYNWQQLQGKYFDSSVCQLRQPVATSFQSAQLIRTTEAAGYEHLDGTAKN